MKKLLLTIFTCLALASDAFAQNDYPTYEQLSSDYDQVAIVAHVRVRSTKVVDEIGGERAGYYLYAVRCRVIEPLKGRIRRGQLLEFHAQVEKGYDTGRLLGEKIVFLNRSMDESNNRWRLFALENSTLPYSKRIIATMRKIKNSSKKRGALDVTAPLPEGSGFYGFAPMQYRPIAKNCRKLFLYFSVLTFTFRTSLNDALARVSKSRIGLRARSNFSFQALAQSHWGDYMGNSKREQVPPGCIPRINAGGLSPTALLKSGVIPGWMAASVSSPPLYSDGREQLQVLPAQDDPELFPILISGKVGYINVAGKIVIEPKFEMKPGELNGHFSDERYFKEGLAIVSEEGRGGFIDKTGRFVIEGPYYPRAHFSGGLARVSDHKNYGPYDIGFMDKAGKFVIRPQFSRAEDFSEGLALVQINNKWGYIDKAGRMVIPPRFDDAGSFRDGFAEVSIRAVRRGFIDKAGRFLPIPHEAEDFGYLREGLIAVKVESKWGFMNTRGRIVIAPQFDPDVDGYGADVYREAFAGGLALVKSNGKWGYINRSGKFVITPKFDRAEPFEEGLAAVYLNGKWGYINRSGEFVTPPKFDQVERFAEGFAAVSIDSKWGFIDRSGKLAIAPQYTGAHHFSEGLASVQVAVRAGRYDCCLWGYVDRTGKMVINPQFISPGVFRRGLAYQTISRFLGKATLSPGFHDEWGYIDRSGKYVWKSTN